MWTRNRSAYITWKVFESKKKKKKNHRPVIWPGVRARRAFYFLSKKKNLTQVIQGRTDLISTPTEGGIPQSPKQRQHFMLAVVPALFWCYQSFPGQIMEFINFVIRYRKDVNWTIQMDECSPAPLLPWHTRRYFRNIFIRIFLTHRPKEFQTTKLSHVECQARAPHLKKEMLSMEAFKTGKETPL